MTTFDEREDGFERKFAHDQALHFKVLARRDKLLGLWAAEKMGLTTEAAADYAASVVVADVAQTGVHDIGAKIFTDLAAAGVDVTEQQVHRALEEFEAVAAEQIGKTG